MIDRSPVRGVVNSVAEILADAVEISELQIQLLQQDTHNAIRNTLRPLVWLMVSGCLMLAALPVLGMSIALLIIATTSIADWAAYVIVAGSMLAFAMIVCVVAVQKMKSASHSFNASCSELKQNVAWLKSVIRRESRNTTFTSEYE
jgi:uncharacterized membrane protein YqjE